MRNKKFSLKDIEIVQQTEYLNIDNLSKIIGGITSNTADCSKCDCWWSNCNGDTTEKKASESPF
jgi:hypothetical protein